MKTAARSLHLPPPQFYSAVSEMEETEAMAIQFSSLNLVDDIFSKIPEQIIHSILGSLPCTKDVVRTSAISKSWFKAWRTFPIPEFNLEDFVSLRQQDEEKTKQFIDFVDNTLQRFGRQNGDAMKIFKLRTLNKMAHHITRWIGMALDNKIEHLDLFIITGDPLLPNSIPDRVLSAYWLKSLKLVGHTIDFNLTGSSRVDLPSLTSLHIESSENIGDEDLEQLLRGCPFLEHISLLDCELLSEVDFFENPNLLTLEVIVKNINAELTAISVRAPKLISFCYSCDSERDVVVEIHNSPWLKVLSFSYLNKTDEWFHKFIAQFPLIEILGIHSGNILRKIRISNPHLEKIYIANCCNLEDVVISSKKLKSILLCTLPSSIPKPFIRIEMDNHPNVSKAYIRSPFFGCDHLMVASWYWKLKEFMSMPFTFKSVIIKVHTYFAYCKYGDSTGEDMHKKLPPTACNIEKLRLSIIAPSSCHYPILNGLFSACHPTTIKLDVNSSDNSFIELVCHELWKINDNCCCKEGFKCWKHQLKEVKIEKIKGIKLEEELGWYALFRLLRTDNARYSINLKLRW